MSREAIASRPPTLWRYAEVLPGSAEPVTLGEGMTPLLPLRFLASALGVRRRVLLKDEALNPTGSFKARGMATRGDDGSRARGAAHRAPFGRKRRQRGGGVRRARRARGRPVPPRGHAGAVPARGRRPRRDRPPRPRRHRRVRPRDAGARRRARRGSTCRRCASRTGSKGKRRWGTRSPSSSAGRSPTSIIYPTGGGTGLIGMWKAFEELEQLGLIVAGPEAAHGRGAGGRVRADRRGVRDRRRRRRPRGSTRAPTRRACACRPRSATR